LRSGLFNLLKYFTITKIAIIIIAIYLVTIILNWLLLNGLSLYLIDSSFYN
jgi:hypothetical protein